MDLYIALQPQQLRCQNESQPLWAQVEHSLRLDDKSTNLQMTPIVAGCSDVISLCWFLVYHHFYAFNLLICFHDWEIFQQNIILFNSSCNALRWNIYTVMTLTVVIRNPCKNLDICILLLKWGTGLRGRNKSKNLSGTFSYNIHLKLILYWQARNKAPDPAGVRSCLPQIFLSG